MFIDDALEVQLGLVGHFLERARCLVAVGRLQEVFRGVLGTFAGLECRQHLVVAVVASLGGQGKIEGAVEDAIRRDFGGTERWRAEFVAMGKALGGGSGWVLLTYSRRDGKLINQWAWDHTCSLAGGHPILALDMYEHAYHIDYGATAGAYVDAFMANVNWASVSRMYEAAVKL